LRSKVEESKKCQAEVIVDVEPEGEEVEEVEEAEL